MSEQKSGLEAETQHETATFEHFGREWSVPTKRHLSHIVRMRNALRTGFEDQNVLVAETMLGPDQFAALLGIDPDESALNGFVDAMASAMGLGNSGNSTPSSPSS